MNTKETLRRELMHNIIYSNTYIDVVEDTTEDVVNL